MRCLQRKLCMSRRGIFARSDLRIHIRSLWIEKPELQPSGKQPCHCLINRRFVDESLMYRVHERRILLATTQVIACLYCNGGSVRGLRRKVMSIVTKEIADCAAIGDDIPVEFPVLPQRF